MRQGEIGPLHPYLERERENILRFHARELAEADTADTNHLTTAGVWHLGNAIRSFTVGLDDIGRRFLIRARSTLKVVFEKGPKPYIGSNPAAGYFMDDLDLNRHWAIAHQVCYKIDSILDGRGDERDLREGIGRLDALWEGTSGLSTRRLFIDRTNILCEYLWFCICARRCQSGIERASPFVGTPISEKTIIKSFARNSAMLRFLLLVARFVNGERSLRNATVASFRALFDIYRDIEHGSERMWRSGPGHAFESALLWEAAFGNPPDPKHALALVCGTDDLSP